jgi:hypothetical protein
MLNQHLQGYLNLITSSFEEQAFTENLYYAIKKKIAFELIT